MVIEIKECEQSQDQDRNNPGQEGQNNGTTQNRGNLGTAGRQDEDEDGGRFRH